MRRSWRGWATWTTQTLHVGWQSEISRCSILVTAYVSVLTPVHLAIDQSETDYSTGGQKGGVQKET